MKILYQEDHFALVRLEEPVRVGETEWIMLEAGIYLQNFKTSWYRVEIDGGRLVRMRLAGYHSRLSRLLREAREEAENED